jgi:hypothetical protein
MATSFRMFSWGHVLFTLTRRTSRLDIHCEPQRVLQTMLTHMMLLHLFTAPMQSALYLFVEVSTHTVTAQAHLGCSC